jgi:hypothetical protein
MTKKNLPQLQVATAESLLDWGRQGCSTLMTGLGRDITMPGYQLKLKERRISDRKRLTGLMPGRFVVDQKDVDAKPLDVSAHGLGIVCDTQIAVGSKAILHIGERQIPLEVLWSEQDFGKHDMWRYGLVCSDQKINIESEFRKAGCLK